MAKRKSCRRTADENKIHEKAVKMRKMTDEQLVHYVEDRVAKAHSEGFNRGVNENKKPALNEVSRFLGEVSCLKGIGTATVDKMRDFAYHAGYIV